jgi:hypothetical protein
MRKDDYSISPIINHDAQSIKLNLYAKQFNITRKINKQTIGDFLIKLSYETWDQIFSSENVNEMLNLFLDTYLKMYFSSFPQKKIEIFYSSKEWITTGIKTSCKHKRELYKICKNTKKTTIIKTAKFYLRLSKKPKS